MNIEHLAFGFNETKFCNFNPNGVRGGTTCPHFFQNAISPWKKGFIINFQKIKWKTWVFTVFLHSSYIQKPRTIRVKPQTLVGGQIFCLQPPLPPDQNVLILFFQIKNWWNNQLFLDLQNFHIYVWTQWSKYQETLFNTNNFRKWACINLQEAQKYFTWGLYEWKIPW